jgi:hypothetical protein
MSVDIVNLIESNPITKFSGDYQTKLIEKVKQIFTNYEQQLFLSSFYCYLKYNSKNDFVIDLDNVWKWLGFSSKFNAKRLLENKFIINKDYKLLLLQSAKQSNQTKGGHNKETFKWLLSVKPSINISADEEYVFRDACENGHLETAKFLLSVNPSINIRVYERANLKNHFNNNTNIIFLNLFTFQTPILHIIK